MKKLFLSVFLLIFVLAAAGLAQAATDLQKQAAIDKGLAHLATIQNADGSWGSPWYYPVAHTAAALLAFTEQYYKPTSWNGQNYLLNVQKAADYLFQSAQTIDISAGPFWKPNWGKTTGFVWNGGEDIYQTGLVLPAISRMTAGIGGITPTSVITSTNPNVNGKTYLDVIRGTVDTFVYGQVGPNYPPYHGGWHYVVNSTDADNSTSQWPVVGMLFSQAVSGVTIPNETKAALINWINYIQGPDGSSGYMAPLDWATNEAKTGGLLLEMVLAGGGGSMTNALNYLNNNWGNPASGWWGNFGQPYSMWSIYKGLEATIGLEDTTHSTNRYNAGQANWWEDYCEWLVNNQNGDGSWSDFSGYGYWGDPLCTAWYINILNATETPPPPTPIPGSVVLLGSGLLGLGVLRWRMKK
jgi:hypothetical protein